MNNGDSRNQNIFNTGGLPMNYNIQQQNQQFYYQGLSHDPSNFQGNYINPMMMNSQNLNQVYISPENMAQINSQMNISQPIQVYNTDQDPSKIHTPLLYQSQIDSNNTQNQAQNRENSNINSNPVLFTKSFLKSLLTFIFNNNGNATVAKGLMEAFINGKLTVESFVSNMNHQKIYQFSNDQINLLQQFELYRTKNSSPHVINMARSQSSINISGNVGNIVPAQSVKIPQLTMVQNQMKQNIQTSSASQMRTVQGIQSVQNQSSHHQFSQNVPPSNTHMNVIQGVNMNSLGNPTINQFVDQTIPSIVNQQRNYIEFSDLSDKLGLNVKIEENSLKADPVEEDDNDVDFCGVNIKQEDEILDRLNQISHAKPSSQKIEFNSTRMFSMVKSECFKKNLNVSNEEHEKIVAALSFALEVKLRQILQQGTLFVHHRLKNFELKGTQYKINNIEQQVSYIEEVFLSKESRKMEKTKKSKESDKKGKIDLQQGHSNDVMMAAVRGSRKIENFGQMLKDSKMPSSLADSSKHQRMRYSAQKQRKIFKRDLVYVFEQDKSIKRYLNNQYLYKSS